MEPATATAVLTTAAKTEIVRRFTSGITGLFGDTKTDRERKESAAAALRQALNGDVTGINWLYARSGARPDATIVKTAPSSAQHIFRTALRTYYKETGILPPDDIGRYLGIPGVSSAGSKPVTPAVGGFRVDVPVTESGGLSPAGTASPIQQAGIGGVSPVVAIVILAGLGLALTRRK